LILIDVPIRREIADFVTAPGIFIPQFYKWPIDDQKSVILKNDLPYFA
jgi:hypothetical protein